MSVSLVNSNGDPISTFGSGNSAFATGNTTNPGLFSSFRTFGDSGGVNGSGTNGNKVQMWACDGNTAAQNWTVNVSIHGGP
jgi:hypothetical protein